MTEQFPPLNEDVQEQAAAYSLGALTPAEAAAFEAQLAAPSVRAEVAACRAAVEALAVAPALRLPPPSLREQILAVAESPATPAPVLRWPRLAPWLAAAALFILCLGLGARVAQQQAAINEYQAFAAMPNTVRMEAGDVAPNAHGQFYLAPDSRQAMLLASDLPALPDDKVYQLWLVDKNGVRENGGLFRADEGGYATLVVRATRPLSEYARIGVTTEPKGGSPGPTSGRVIGADLSRATQRIN